MIDEKVVQGIYNETLNISSHDINSSVFRSLDFESERKSLIASIIVHRHAKSHTNPKIRQYIKTWLIPLMTYNQTMDFFGTLSYFRSDRIICSLAKEDKHKSAKLSISCMNAIIYPEYGCLEVEARIPLLWNSTQLGIEEIYLSVHHFFGCVFLGSSEKIMTEQVMLKNLKMPHLKLKDQLSKIIDMLNSLKE